MAKVSRREFLKMGAAGAALVALGEGLGVVASAGGFPGRAGSVSRTTGRLRHAFPSICQLCPARCGILGFIEDGRLVKIEGNPKHPNNGGRICAKGQAGVNLLYDPDRLLYPIKRVGARGEGKWERVSWEEALGEVAWRLRGLRESGHPEKFVFVAGTMANQTLVTRFLNAYGTPNALNRYCHGDYNKIIAQNLTWGESVEVNDAAHAKYILNFGANPYETYLYHLPLVQRIVEGRLRNGAKLVTFDVRLSNTAGRSDEWIPLKPGTDGLVALALAQVILEEGLYDEAFLREWTNYPVEGLARHLAAYTPERVEGESGVPALTLRRIAREFASSKPATTISGSGVTRQRRGVQNERCVALLDALTGNIDVKGGYCRPRTYAFPEPEPVPQEPRGATGLAHTEDFPFGPHATAHTVLSLIKEGKEEVGLFMTYMHNPAYSDPEAALSQEVLKDERAIPFFVAVDTYLSETASLADLVLPDTTYLERWDLESGPSFEMVPFVALRQPVVSPLGEAVPFHDVLLQLSRRIGGGLEKFFEFSGAESYLRQVVASIEGLSQAGGLDYLKKEGVWFDPQAQPDYGAFRKGGFKTPSGKFEIYSKALEERGLPPLPTYEPDPGGLKEGELLFANFKVNVLTLSNANSKWLSEITHDIPVLINPQTAQALGIENGDRVEIRSQLGSLIARVRLSQGIHPQALGVAGGLGHWGLGGIAQGRKFPSPDADTRLVWWQEHGNGVSPNNLIPVARDVIGGGQAWNGTVITIAKA